MRAIGGAVLFLLPCSLVGQSPATAAWPVGDDDAPSSAWWVGVAPTVAYVPAYCPDHGPRNREVLAGAGAHVVWAHRSGWEVEGRGSVAGAFGDYGCLPVMSFDQASVRREYEEIGGGGLVALEVGLGYAFPELPFLRVSLGGGWELGRSAPHASAGVGFRAGSRVRFFSDASVRRVAVSFTDWFEPGEDDVFLLSRVGGGRTWTTGYVVRLGIERVIR